MRAVFKLFEGWIDPLRSEPAQNVPHGGMAFLFHFVSQARWTFASMLIAGGLSAFVEISVFNFLGKLVDLMESGERDGFFETHFWLLIWMAFVVLVLRSIVNVLLALLENQAVVPGFLNLVRWQSHQRVMRQSLSYFNDDLAGRLAQKVMQSGTASADFMINLLQVVWFIIVYALTTLVLVADLDWRLGALVALWLVCFAAAAWFFVPRVRKASKEAAHTYSSFSGRLVDTYTNIQSVKLFGSIREENRGGIAALKDLMVKLWIFMRLLTTIRMVMSTVNGAMIVVIAGMAILVWQNGGISTGHVAFALSLILRLNILLNRLFNQLNGLFRHFGTIQDSMETIVKPIVVTDIPDAVDLVVTEGRVDFQNVRFHYGQANTVIDNLNLTIRPGERVGLVGRSGAGKTTFASLLLRFYDVESGAIRIDGQDVREVRQESLRKSIGMVTQDPSLLHRSIRENVMYGRPEADEEALLEAVRRAHAFDFIQDLKDQKGRQGLDAFVGERGVKLSGGQRQRIAIARVLLKNAPILVLDEATSALDSEVEAAIQENLQTLMAGKTVVAIAHRLSTIAAMDRLIVLDKGKIVQEGAHDELLQDAEGLYADLWHRQSGGFLPSRESTD